MSYETNPFACLAWFAVKNFSTRFGNGRILPQIMEAIGITLVCVAALVVPALLLSRRQRNGLRRNRRHADGGFWFPGGNDSNAEQPHHHHHDSGSGGHHGGGFDGGGHHGGGFDGGGGGGHPVPRLRDHLLPIGCGEGIILDSVWKSNYFSRKAGGQFRLQECHAIGWL